MELNNSLLNLLKNPLKRLIGKNIIIANSCNSEAQNVVKWFDFTEEDLNASQTITIKKKEFIKIKSIIWFIPEFDNPFWGGIYTILRFADYLKSKKDIQNYFVVIGDVQRDKISVAIGKAFPSLKNDVLILKSEQEMYKIAEVDATICTLWSTAYHSLKFNKTGRKFYFIQDYETLFYPAGSESALVDSTYRFGFYGIANTMTIRNIYKCEYNGIAEYFNPCVDREVFFPDLKKEAHEPYKVFFYGRPGHPRNGFELGIAALRKLKAEMGEKVNIITAGSKWKPSDFGLDGIVENLGLLTYKETADLYRKCDLGLVMMFTRHPSYIPFELMASGCLVVTNYNPANTWLLKDKENCLISFASASCLCSALEMGLTNIKQREKLVKNALNTINDYDSWDKEIEKIYSFMCHPRKEIDEKE